MDKLAEPPPAPDARPAGLGADRRPAAARRVTICIATMRRESVVETLRSLEGQVLPPDIAANIIVADNDATPSARQRVLAQARRMRTPVSYIHAPERNISIARNACLEAVETEWIAFIDDDETAAPDWLAKLFAEADRDRLDVAFGPVLAVYPKDAPAWIQAKDYHTSRPIRRSGVVQTGHAGNVLFRWTHPAAQGELFKVEKGRTGGEDTEFFFRLWRKGLRLGIAEGALLYEPVEPYRLNFGWIARRKFRAGQTYGLHAAEGGGATARLALLAAAGAKALICGAAAGLLWLAPTARNFWALRGVFHSGVCAASLGIRETSLY